MILIQLRKNGWMDLDVWYRGMVPVKYQVLKAKRKKRKKWSAASVKTSVI